MYKRDNEKDYVVIVNAANSGQSGLFEKVIIDSQNLAVHFEVRVIPFFSTLCILAPRVFIKL